MNNTTANFPLAIMAAITSGRADADKLVVLPPRVPPELRRYMKPEDAALPPIVQFETALRRAQLAQLDALDADGPKSREHDRLEEPPPRADVRHSEAFGRSELELLRRAYGLGHAAMGPGLDCFCQ